MPLSYFLYISDVRTTKRPVPLEHSLFYSGELYNIYENETFISQGLKAARDAHKKKNSSTTSRGAGPSPAPDVARASKRETPNRGKLNKHAGSQSSRSFSGTVWGNQTNGSGQNTWGARRTTWLSLIDKLSKKSLLPVC